MVQSNPPPPPPAPHNKQTHTQVVQSTSTLGDFLGDILRAKALNFLMKDRILNCEGHVLLHAVLFGLTVHKVPGQYCTSKLGWRDFEKIGHLTGCAKLF